LPTWGRDLPAATFTVSTRIETMSRGTASGFRRENTGDCAADGTDQIARNGSSGWDDIPAAERFELLATIREVREWRYGENEPPRLQPIRDAALALYEFRVRSGGTNRGRPQVTATCNKGASKTQGELFNDASAN
jgi:hypothetical protein